MVLVVREVVMRPAQRSSHASHGRQRKEKEVREDGFAVGSLRRPLWRGPAKVEICLMQMFSMCVVRWLSSSEMSKCGHKVLCF
jgi:hypothetical protein